MPSYTHKMANVSVTLFHPVYYGQNVRVRVREGFYVLVDAKRFADVLASQSLG